MKYIHLLGLTLIFLTANSQTPLLWGISNLRGINENGSIYKYNPDAETLEDMVSFDSADLYSPTTVICYAKGSVYGIARKKVDNAFIIYSVEVASKSITVLHTFNSNQGGYPFSGLEENNSILYGVCGSGGANNLGTLFSIPLTGNSFNKLHDFDGSSGLIKSNNGSSIEHKRLTVTNDLIYHFQHFDYCTKFWKYSISQNTFNYTFQLDSTNYGKTEPSTNLENVNNELLIACTYGSSGGGTGQISGNVYKIDLKTDDITKVISGSEGIAGIEGELEYSWVDGKIYGISRIGGGSMGGFAISTGSIIVIDVPYFTSVEVLYGVPDFDNGAHPRSGIVLASNNILYNCFSVSNFMGFLGVTKSGQLHNIKKFWNAGVPATYLVQVDGLKTDVHEIANENYFEIFPNPASEKIHIRQKQGGRYSASLFASDGRMVKSTITEHISNLDVSELSKGFYFLKLIDERSEKIQYEKILVQ